MPNPTPQSIVEKLSEAMLFPFRRLAMWLVWNVRLGRFAPHVFGFAIGRKGRRIDDGRQ